MAIDEIPTSEPTHHAAANTITQAQLAEYAQNGAVERITLKLAADGSGFNLYVTLTWKKGEQLLITQQKKPRVWTSLDRLRSHIESHFEAISHIDITLKKTAQ